MSETTTIKISKSAARWWTECRKKSGLSSAFLFDILVERCKLKKQAELYKALPMPSKVVKPLCGVKIDKKYTPK
jgi:hypothetical protein